MSTLVTNEFFAQPGRGDDVANLLIEILGESLQWEGCETIRIVRDQDDPDHVAGVTQWTERRKFEEYLVWRTERGFSATFEAMLTRPFVIHYYDIAYYGEGIAARQGKKTPTMDKETGMTNLSLPPLVQKYFAAAKDNDWDTLAGCFIEDGIVVDEGHTYLGRAEIIRWREETGSQWTYTSELTKAEPVGATGYHVVNHLEGDFPDGVADLHYQFTFKEDLIYTLTIAP